MTDFLKGMVAGCGMVLTAQLAACYGNCIEYGTYGATVHLDTGWGSLNDEYFDTLRDPAVEVRSNAVIIRYERQVDGDDGDGGDDYPFNNEEGRFSVKVRYTNLVFEE